jgi:hypothetical protein
MPLVLGVSLARHDMREHLANNPSADVVETHLNAPVATTNKELRCHHASRSTLD